MAKLVVQVMLYYLPARTRLVRVRSAGPVMVAMLEKELQQFAKVAQTGRSLDQFP